MANKHQVLELYKSTSMNTREMADKLDCSSAYIRATLARNGLASRSSPLGPITERPFLSETKRRAMLLSRAEKLRSRADDLEQMAEAIRIEEASNESA